MVSMGSLEQVITALDDASGRLVELPTPTHGFTAMEQTDVLLRIQGRIGLAIESRIGVVEKHKTAKVAGYSSTTAWLRSGGRMGKYRAGQLRRDAIQFGRLPRVLAALSAGEISHDMASAIASASSLLGKDEDVTDTEEILLTLALDPDTTVEKIGIVGKHLRAVLDPDGSLSAEEKAYGNRFLSMHVDDIGGMAGSFYLPPEAAAKLQAILDKYARARDAADGGPKGRTQAQRNADAIIQLLNEQVATEILVLINAESLPDDHPDLRQPEAADQPSAGPAAAPAAGGATASAVESALTSPDVASLAPPAEHPPPDVNRNWSLADRDSLDEESANRLRLALAKLGVEPDPLPCPTCARPVNRNLPGLILPTGHVMPAKHLRRLLSTSSIYRVVLDAKRRILDASYQVRLVPDWMRRLVLIAYPTCAYDDCCIEANRCEMDHVYSWAVFNRTKHDEIIPACGYHNRDRADHPDKYRLRKQRDGRWRFETINRYRT